MTQLLVPLIVIHVAAVIAKLSIFFVIPRLDSVEGVRNFLKRYRPFERTADWILWLTGLGLISCVNWQVLTQAWMYVSIGLYLIVFLAVRFALTREMEKIADSKKLLAAQEIKKLRTNNWCVGILAVVLLGVIAYLMMTKP